MNKLPQNISGKIVKFSGNGRKLGYPTANLAVATNLADGVYFGWAMLGESEKQPTLIFIGTPTTVGDKERRVEAHILDLPDKDYYDQNLEIEVAHFHRSNQKFASIDELRKAMNDDERAARSWFSEH